MATETIEIDTQIDGWMGGWEPRPLHWLRFRECRYAADILSADASFSISSADRPRPPSRALHSSVACELRLRPRDLRGRTRAARHMMGRGRGTGLNRQLRRVEMRFVD